MQINTKYFSTIDYTEEEVVHFPSGIIGFEVFRDYIIIQFNKENGSLFCLQSIEEPALAFVALKIANYIPDYPQTIADMTDTITSIEDFLFYTICVIHEPISESTTNLKCPIVINFKTHEGAQIILENSEFAFKFPFSQLFKTEEA
ncbi:MAG: flagellar assembly protein FliW [Bacillota bacterium]